MRIDFEYHDRLEQADRMASPSLIVYGAHPRVTPAICRRFKLTEVIHQWSPGDPLPQQGALILLRNEEQLGGTVWEGRALSFNEVMQEV